ncbi:hypothetical protein LIER_43932 [Lithospermum erythrorhizon]|uniref:Uncharacterized protein n=1 Tax=Lithospermum erythrorhizon TaxID=34254 RepID=A0AAV3R8V9_LITER
MRRGKNARRRRRGKGRVCGHLLGADGRDTIAENGRHLLTQLTTNRGSSGAVSSCRSMGGIRRRNIQSAVDVEVSISWINGGRRTLLRGRRPVSGLISGHRATGDARKRGVDYKSLEVDQREY